MRKRSEIKKHAGQNSKKRIAAKLHIRSIKQNPQNDAAGK